QSAHPPGCPRCPYTSLFRSDVPGDSKGIMLERVKRAEEADRIGSVPVPGSAKGMLKSTFDMALGKSPELLVDKLGERLAFERSGDRKSTRLNSSHVKSSYAV